MTGVKLAIAVDADNYRIDGKIVSASELENLQKMFPGSRWIIVNYPKIKQTET
jgi:hypothetical protein